MKREGACGGGDSGEAWQAANAEVEPAGPEIKVYVQIGLLSRGSSVPTSSSAPQAHKMARSAWQLMFLGSDGEVSFMSVGDAQRQGFTLLTSTKRVVLRSQYQQKQAEVLQVGRPPTFCCKTLTLTGFSPAAVPSPQMEGMAVKMLRVSMFRKQQLTVTMLDMSMACAVSKS